MILNTWKLNIVEIQDPSKNLFLFKFSSKRDMKYILKSGSWSFDRALVILERVLGEEQPFELNMHFGTFWVKIYELPLMLKSEAMANKLGNIIGEFVDMGHKEGH